MLRGQCNCGAIAFEITTETSEISVCHCSICRRHTGAAAMPVLVVENDAFRWLHGEDRITHWRKPDADWESHFCPTCGSVLPGRNDDARMFVPAGGLADGDAVLKIARHIFVGSKAHWDVIGDDGRRFEESIG